MSEKSKQVKKIKFLNKHEIKNYFLVVRHFRRI